MNHGHILQHGDLPQDHFRHRMVNVVGHAGMQSLALWGWQTHNLYKGWDKHSKQKNKKLLLFWYGVELELELDIILEHLDKLVYRLSISTEHNSLLNLCAGATTERIFIQTSLCHSAMLL